MNNKIKVSFFGTPEYSTIVLEALRKANCEVVCCVTKPPTSVGREQKITESPVSIWAQKNKIPIICPTSNLQKSWEFADKNAVMNEVLKYSPDILITADYAMKIPEKLIKSVKFGGLNVHPSLLPSYQGPAPIPWAILRGEKETGVSIATLTQKFDAGKIIAQTAVPIENTDTTPILLNKLFTLGSNLLLKTIPQYIQNTKYDPPAGGPNTLSPSYFPRLTREHGFIPWEIIKSAVEGSPLPKNEIPNWPIAKYFDKTYLIHNSSLIIHNSFRALHPWPGLWTKVKIKGIDKRLKILKINLSLITYRLSLVEVQLEGKQPIQGKNVDQFLGQII